MRKGKVLAMGDLAKELADHRRAVRDHCLNCQEREDLDEDEVAARVAACHRRPCPFHALRPYQGKRS